MKKYLSILAILLVISPSIALASWWNPFSWSIFHRADKTAILESRINELEKKLDEKESTTSESQTYEQIIADRQAKAAEISSKLSGTTTQKAYTQVIAERQAKAAEISQKLSGVTQKAVKTWTLPNGAVIDEAGNIISQPTNSNPITSNIQAGVKILSSEEIYSLVSQSVVLISTPLGHGTGFIIDDGRYTITNQHVVEKDENTGEVYKNVTVKLSSGASFSGVVLGSSKSTDLALIYNGNLRPKPLKFGKSDDYSLKTGSEVYALGFPLSFTSTLTLTRGIVSANRQQIEDSGSYIQTDATIHPGNSGGPLVNNKGEVIGINASGVVSKGNISNVGGTGIGFAIPIETAASYIPSLSQYGKSRYEVYPIGSTQTMNKSEQLQIDLNLESSCSSLGFIGNNLTICELYKNYKNDYNWVIKNDY